MLEEYKTAYQELSQATSAEFAEMLSKTEYKKAIRELMGNNTAVFELGLSEQTIRKLERSNIRSMDILVDYYDKGWLESQTYLKEIANKLEEYIRDMLSMLVVEKEPESIQSEESVVITEDAVHEAEITIPELKAVVNNPSPLDSFIQHEHLQEAIAFYKDHDEPIDVLKLSTRSYNAMRRAGYLTVSQLLSCTNEQIDETRNLGKKSKQEINDRMIQIIDDLCSLSVDTTIQEETNIAETDINKAKETPVQVFRNGTELFTDPLYHDSVIRFFEKKQLSLNHAGLSVRSVNALARNQIVSFAVLLAAYPDHISDIKNLGAKSILEIRNYVETTLEQYTASLTRWLMDGETMHFTDQEIRRMILSMYQKSNGFYGYSFKEFRENIPDSVSDDEIRVNVSTLMQEKKLEYVDFRCYKVYPSIFDMIPTFTPIERKRSYFDDDDEEDLFGEWEDDPGF